MIDWIDTCISFVVLKWKYWKNIYEVKEILFEVTLKIEMSEIISEKYRIKWKNE